MNTQKLSKVERDRIIDELFRQMYQFLLNFARGYLDSSLAEIVVQDTFLTATQKCDSMMSSGNVEGWLVNTLKHKIHNVKRRQRIRAEHDTIVDDPESFTALSGAGTPDINDEIAFRELESACIQAVGKEAFMQFAERYLYHIPIKEAAAKYGLTESAYKSRTARTRAKLQKLLKNLF